MLIKRNLPLTGEIETKDLPVTEEQMEKYRMGAMLHVAFPHLCNAERAFILSGATTEDFEGYAEEDSDTPPLGTLDVPSKEERPFHNDIEIGIDMEKDEPLLLNIFFGRQVIATFAVLYFGYSLANSGYFGRPVGKGNYIFYTVFDKAVFENFRENFVHSLNDDYIVISLAPSYESNFSWRVASSKPVSM